MNKLKRFGTIYSYNMNKVIEETILNDTKQMDELYEEIEDLKKIINNKDIIIKNINDENKILKDKIEILENLINKNSTKEEIKTERLLDFNKYKETLNKGNNKKNILTPPKTPDNNSFKPKPAYKLFEEENKETFYNTKEDITNKNENNIEKDNNLNTKNKDKEEDKINSDDNTKKYTLRAKNKFEDKTLPILERCNVIAYNYNIDNHKKKNNIELLDFIGSEHKVMIKFNSIISEKINTNDKEIWNDIFKFKIENGELHSYNKYYYKWKILRCKELYDKYGESLGKFRIYVNYFGKITPIEWNQYLIDFDKLYKDTIKEEDICKHKYKNEKLCNRVCCNINHKEEK